MLLAVMTATAQKKYSITGKLDGKTDIRLDMQVNGDDIVCGETTYYRTNGKMSKIKFIGYYETDSENPGKAYMNLNEYDGTKICGHWAIDVSNNKITGAEWNLYDKSLSISNIVPSQVPQGKTFFAPVTGAAVSGEYSYSYRRYADDDEWGGSVTLRYTKGKVRYSMGNVTPNIAEAEGTATLKGSYFNSNHKNYKFRVYTDKNFIVVLSANNGYVNVDDWGAHATVAGIYIREKK